MPAELIRSSALSDVAEDAYASVVPEGMRLVLLAGSCPWDPGGRTAGVGDYRAQAMQCVENLRAALGEDGATLTDEVPSHD